MSALRTALRPALTPALGSARRGVSRYFTKFDNVAQVYIQIASQVDVSIGDIVEITFQPQSGQQPFATIFDSRATNRIVARNDSGNWFFSGLSNVTIDGVATTNGDPFPQGDSLHRLRATITVNSIIEYIGSNYLQTGTAFFKGILADFSVISGGNHLVKMPINRYYTPQNNIVLDESGNGNNGTFFNIAAGRSKYYQQRADGNFVDLQGNVLEVAY